MNRAWYVDFIKRQLFYSYRYFKIFVFQIRILFRVIIFSYICYTLFVILNSDNSIKKIHCIFLILFNYQFSEHVCQPQPIGYWRKNTRKIKYEKNYKKCHTDVFLNVTASFWILSIRLQRLDCPKMLPLLVPPFM